MMQVSLWIDRGQLDQAEQALYACGALSVSIQDAADTPILEPPPAATPLWPHLIVTGLFSYGLSNDSIHRTLRSELGQDLRIELSVLPERDWVRVGISKVFWGVTESQQRRTQTRRRTNNGQGAQPS